MAWSAPAADTGCPIMDLIETVGMEYAWLPSAFLKPFVSQMS